MERRDFPGCTLLSSLQLKIVVNHLKIDLAFFFLLQTLKILAEHFNVTVASAWKKKKKVSLPHRGELSESTGRGDIKTRRRQTSTRGAYLTLNYLQAKINQFSKVMANIISCPLKYSLILYFSARCQNLFKIT